MEYPIVRQDHKHIKHTAEFHIEERVVIAKTKKRPLSALQFNAFAIVFLFVLMPFAVAVVSNAGESAGKELNDSFDFTQGGSNPYPPTYGGIPIWWWNNGGKNYSSLYSGTCALVVDGLCSDTGGFSPAGTGFDPFFHPSNGIVAHQTHSRGSDFGVDPYVGSSGSGPFEWLIPEGSQNAIENNATFDVLKYGFIDHTNSYNCASHPWVDLELEFSIEFVYDNETKRYDGFSSTTSNRFIHYPYPTYHEECNVGFYIEYDFNSFESLEMVNWNSGKWDETDFYISIDVINRQDGLNIANTELPFAGIDEFTLTSQYSPVDQTQANFFINMGTLILAVGTFALAIGSTPYWDPFKNIFKGAV